MTAETAGWTFNWALYGWCFLGIVVSVLLPPLWAYVQTQFRPPAAALAQDGGPTWLERAWAVVAPYLALGVASALTAVLIVVLLGTTVVDPRAAMLAGYAWDSTLQKLRGPPPAHV